MVTGAYGLVSWFWASIDVVIWAFAAFVVLALTRLPLATDGRRSGQASRVQ
jgi:hypothetical protein